MATDIEVGSQIGAADKVLHIVFRGADRQPVAFFGDKQGLYFFAFVKERTCCEIFG